MGEKEVFEVEEGTKLGALLLRVDLGIMDAGKKKGIDTAYKTTLAGGVLNACVVFINGAAPEKMLEQELQRRGQYRIRVRVLRRLIWILSNSLPGTLLMGS